MNLKYAPTFAQLYVHRCIFPSPSLHYCPVIFPSMHKLLLLSRTTIAFLFQVNYINAHATSTIVGDIAEINAIKKVFKDTSGIKINATKVSCLLALDTLWLTHGHRFVSSLLEQIPWLLITKCSNLPFYYWNFEIMTLSRFHFASNGIISFSQSMIGHCLGAAGGLEAIATVKAITTGWIHPTINQFVS